MCWVVYILSWVLLKLSGMEKNKFDFGVDCRLILFMVCIKNNIYY